MTAPAVDGSFSEIPSERDWQTDTWIYHPPDPQFATRTWSPVSAKTKGHTGISDRGSGSRQGYESTAIHKSLATRINSQLLTVWITRFGCRRRTDGLQAALTVPRNLPHPPAGREQSIDSK